MGCSNSIPEDYLLDYYHNSAKGDAKSAYELAWLYKRGLMYNYCIENPATQKKCCYSLFNGDVQQELCGCPSKVLIQKNEQKFQEYMRLASQRGHSDAIEYFALKSKEEKQQVELDEMNGKNSFDVFELAALPGVKPEEKSMNK